MQASPKIVKRAEPDIWWKGFLKRIFFVEILKGMSLTMSYMFKKPVTRQYPKEKRESQPGFRGMHALVRKPLTRRARCVGCGLCAAVCPSKCITIYTSEGKTHEKVVDRYEIEILRCLFCGLCVEACPFQAIVLTGHYEYADASKASFRLTKEMLMDNWDKYMTEETGIINPARNGKYYFNNFWAPRKNHFETSANQAVFKGKKAQ
ncbi:MAG: NADH-quinone oxidoreductase subunit NuoI [Nitrospirae bacterium]|nr:NADH-quinone oxidoreductase subunit NuoI [Nitrospirota bacterium]